MHQDVLVLIHKDRVEVTFQIETNEEGTMVEAIAMDSNGDGKLSSIEQSTYFADLDARLRENLQTEIGDRDIALTTVGEVELSPPARKTFRFRGAIVPPLQHAVAVDVHNDNFIDRPGRVLLDVKAAEGCAFMLFFNYHTRASGQISLGDGYSIGLAPLRKPLDWSRWSWPRFLLIPKVLFGSTIALIIAACLLFLLGKPQPWRRYLTFALAAAGIALGSFACFPREGASVPEETWVAEFRDCHTKLSSALAEYHRSGDPRPLAAIASPDAVRHLTSATRVITAGDEISGDFELRRLRPIASTLLETPRFSIFPTLRVRHSWRAIGIMRHHGHPHERTRNFTCDYTLRVTKDGLKLLNCTDWHQLPDEPIE